MKTNTFRFGPAIAVLAIGSIWTTMLPAAEIADDFTANDWRAGNAKAPAKIEASENRLVLTDLPGGEVTWGTSATKRFQNIDLETAPYLVIDLASVSDGFGIKLSGGRSWPKKSVLRTDEPGLFALDIRKATGWEEPVGNLQVMLYAQGSESRIELRSVKITGTLNDEERSALETSAKTIPAKLASVPSAGLLHQAAREDEKPSCADPKDGERTVYADPVTGHEVWRMTDHPVIERHVYYDIPAWNADGSLITWLSRRPGGSRYWIMNADGTNLRPLPKPDDGSRCKTPYWSVREPHTMYFARTDGERVTVMALDVRDGKVSEVVSAPIPESAAKDRAPNFCPPHPDEHHFLFRWGGQDRHETILTVVDSETGKHWTLDTGMPTHRVRFTKKDDLSVFINSNTDPEKSGEEARERTEWIITLDGKIRLLPPGGGHPDWSPDGSWLATFEGGGIWLISHDGETRKQLVKTGAGGHGGFSITTGDHHVADAPRSGPYGNLVYVTEIATGTVTPIAYHGSSYSSWSSEVPDPEATHPAPVCSPDETKIIYDSDVIGQPDIWVAVWKRPAPPQIVRFENGALTWKAPQLHREIKGYNVYRKEGNQWQVAKSDIAATRLDDMPKGDYAVAAREWSGLESPWISASTGEAITDASPPAAPPSPRLVEAGSTHAILEWEPSPEKDLAHYNVYALDNSDGETDLATLAGSPASARFVDWGLSPGDTFFYRITAVDRQGNESPVSGDLQVSIRP